MKKILFMMMACLSLTACMTPQYHRSTQKIPVNVQTHSNLPVSVTVDGEQIPVRMTKAGQSYILLDRSFGDKQILIQQGNVVQEIKLKSVWTKDKWGRFNNYTESEDTTAGLLFLPTNVLSMGGFFLKETFDPDSGRAWYGRIGTFIAAPIALVAGVPLDAYNFVIGGPSTPFINPWREYEIESVRSWKIQEPQKVFYKNYLIQFNVPIPQIKCCVVQ